MRHGIEIDTTFLKKESCISATRQFYALLSEAYSTKALQVFVCAILRALRSHWAG